jgi:Family of unknown function (DUF6338)
MPATFQALGVLVLALLPGALYVWAFERQVGAWGIRLSDRVLRFVGFSAFLHAVFAPLTYRLWVAFVRTGRLQGGDVPLALWLAVLVYIALPTAVGTIVGRGTRTGAAWARWFTGPDPAPRAWDKLFGSRPDGWIRMRLKSGTWLAGAFGENDDGVRSYAAGYPEDPDLFLVDAVELDPETGEFLLDQDGMPVSKGSSILVRWAEVEYLDFFEV